MLGGPLLRVGLALGGMMSGFGMFNALVMSYSRLPLAMAQDGMLPRIFARCIPGRAPPGWRFWFVPPDGPCAWAWASNAWSPSTFCFTAPSSAWSLGRRSPCASESPTCHGRSGFPGEFSGRWRWAWPCAAAWLLGGPQRERAGVGHGRAWLSECCWLRRA